MNLVNEENCRSHSVGNVKCANNIPLPLFLAFRLNILLDMVMSRLGDALDEEETFPGAGGGGEALNEAEKKRRRTESIQTTG